MRSRSFLAGKIAVGINDKDRIEKDQIVSDCRSFFQGDERIGSDRRSILTKGSGSDRRSEKKGSSNSLKSMINISYKYE